jgi:LPXTG-motif cell wall-anchored protein
MKKVAVLCIAALGAALLVLGTGPSASAYPDLSCNLEVDRQVVAPGQTFTATGTAKFNDPDAPQSTEGVVWTFSWNGVTVHRHGSTAKATFTAPEVDSARKIRLTGRATTPLGPCERHIDITVINPVVEAPRTGGGLGHGLLPNTGGPAFWMLVSAVLLLLGGGGAIMASRRRS